MLKKIVVFYKVQFGNNLILNKKVFLMKSFKTSQKYCKYNIVFTLLPFGWAVSSGKFNRLWAVKIITEDAASQQKYF